MTPKLIPTRGSSFITGTGYDPATSTLLIRFADGKQFTYEDFPASLYEAFIGADSLGKFFHATIKDQYTAKRA
jgi:hypothetical protein